MNKIKVLKATIEQLITDVSYWEDHDQILLIGHDNQGQFFVFNQGYTTASGGSGNTLQDALIAYGKVYWQGDYENSKLDWSEVT